MRCFRSSTRNSSLIAVCARPRQQEAFIRSRFNPTQPQHNTHEKSHRSINACINTVFPLSMLSRSSYSDSCAALRLLSHIGYVSLQYCVIIFLLMEYIALGPVLFLFLSISSLCPHITLGAFVVLYSRIVARISQAPYPIHVLFSPSFLVSLYH